MRGLLSTLLLAGSGSAECTGDESFDDAMPSCSPTEFKLSVNKCAFENARFNNPENAYLAGPDFVDMPEIDANATNQCVPVLDGDNYIFTITDDIEDCGTSVNNNGTHVTYENAVQSTIGTDNDIISRKRNMKINFSCFFELEMTLSVADAIKPRIQHFEVDVGITEGVFSVSMGLFETDSFETLVTGNYTIQVPEKLHVGVLIDDDTAMVMQLKKCWATPSSDPADGISYPFIEDFCGDEDELNVYESLIIHENGSTQRGLYSIEAFSFNGNEDGDIYLHCEARICDPTTETCEPICDGSRKRRDVDDDPAVVTTSVGPVTVSTGST